MDKEEMTIYKVDYQYRSSCSMVFDNMHAIAYVEAPKGMWPWDLRKKLEDKFGIVNSFNEICVMPLET